MILTEYGAPLRETEMPEPVLTPGNALLEVLTCGVCFSDVKIARGRMPFSEELPLPHIPGHEVCARVLETDPPGAVASGTRVVVYNVWPCGRCDRCLAGEEQICREPQTRAGFTEPGGFRERMLAPLERLIAVPDNIGARHAAPMTCALGTAYRAVVSKGRVLPGARVVVIGLGGVGIHALQIAHAAGGLALGVDRSRAAVSTARSLGLDADRAEGALAAELHAGTDGDGFDVVIDTVGHPGTVSMAERLVRPGGRIVLVGYLTGEAITLPSARVVLDEIEVVGSRYARRDEMVQAIRLVAEGRVKMIVDRELPLARAEDAFAALENGEVVGRVVVRVNDERTRDGGG